MRSSTGAHFIALDHIRAFAAFMVFTWHFTHGANGFPVSFDYVPALFPFSILDEGHTGVALFMALSGYLFAKLLDGKSINYWAFIWNRVVRLLPLLLVVILIVAIRTVVSGQGLTTYAITIAKGILLPSLPNGGWSITVEFHYYIILPLLLWLLAKNRLWLIAIVILSIALRLFLYQQKGEIQYLAYWTIIGRIDQFVLGMLLYQYRIFFYQRHLLIILTIIIFMMFYWYFDFKGGFYLNPSYPSSSPYWIILPTIEGLVYAAAIAWYDNSFTHSISGVSKFIGRIGEYSYSIYLFHFFIVFHAARFVHEKIMPLNNFYVACLGSLVFFLLMIIPGHISYYFIEAPFLKLRKPYIKLPNGGQRNG